MSAVSAERNLRCGICLIYIHTLPCTVQVKPIGVCTETRIGDLRAVVEIIDKYARFSEISDIA